MQFGLNTYTIACEGSFSLFYFFSFKPQDPSTDLFAMLHMYIIIRLFAWNFISDFNFLYVFFFSYTGLFYTLFIICGLTRKMLRHKITQFASRKFWNLRIENGNKMVINPKQIRRLQKHPSNEERGDCESFMWSLLDFGKWNVC